MKGRKAKIIQRKWGGDAVSPIEFLRRIEDGRVLVKEACEGYAYPEGIVHAVWPSSATETCGAPRQ